MSRRVGLAALAALSFARLAHADSASEEAIQNFVKKTMSAYVQNAPTTKYYRLSTKERSWVDSVVKKKLKDPYSAVMGPMTAGIDKKGVVYVCGSVNAKNSYGAYTGLRPFIGMLSPSLPFNSFSVAIFGGSDHDAYSAIALCRLYGVVPHT